MKKLPLIPLIFRPQVVREVAAEGSEFTAVAVNAITGIFVVAGISLPMQSLFTKSLVALITILFGPLVGFIISSLYSRVEWTVGKRLGGEASLDEVYRLFAWSFLPAGFAAMLYGLVMCVLKEPSTTTEIAAAIPLLFILCCAVRNYGSNIITAQQFTKTRGTLSIIITLVMFLILFAGCGAFLSLLFTYGMGDCTKFITQL